MLVYQKVQNPGFEKRQILTDQGFVQHFDTPRNCERLPGAFYAGEFSGMIHWFFYQFHHPSNPQQQPIRQPYVKRTQ